MGFQQLEGLPKYHDMGKGWSWGQPGLGCSRKEGKRHHQPGWGCRAGGGTVALRELGLSPSIPVTPGAGRGFQDTELLQPFKTPVFPLVRLCPYQWQGQVM